MSQTPKGRQTVQMGIALPPDVYEDVKRLVAIKTEEHGEKYTVSLLGCKVITRWIEKQRKKYGDRLQEYGD